MTLDEHEKGELIVKWSVLIIILILVSGMMGVVLCIDFLTWPLFFLFGVVLLICFGWIVYTIGSLLYEEIYLGMIIPTRDFLFEYLEKEKDDEV